MISSVSLDPPVINEYIFPRIISTVDDQRMTRKIYVLSIPIFRIVIGFRQKEIKIIIVIN